MGIKITKNDLGKFKDRLGKQNFTNIEDKVAEAFVKTGAKFADEEYSKSGISGVQINPMPVSNGETQLIVSKEGLAYIEFGVGEYARTTYHGKLPSEPRTFLDSKGKPHTTDGWEYYYDNPATKRTVKGEKGWFYGKKERIFTTGHPAGNQMYNVANKLREQKTQIVKKAIKGEK